MRPSLLEVGLQVPQPERGRGLRLRRIDQVQGRSPPRPDPRVSLGRADRANSSGDRSTEGQRCAKLAAGNWKMNGISAHLGRGAALDRRAPCPGCEMLLCPPATLLARHGGGGRRAACCGRRAGLPSQGRPAPIPATSRPRCWRDAGASHVILGHSERRADHGETDALVRAKAEAAPARRVWWPSSASARPRRSAMRARRWR